MGYMRGGWYVVLDRQGVVIKACRTWTRRGGEKVYNKGYW